MPADLTKQGGPWPRSDQKLWTFAKGLPWWAWVLVGLAVLYLFNVASGSIYTRKLWSMLHDQIVQEDKAIQEELEKEVTRLDQRKKELILENARIKNQLASLSGAPILRLI